MSSQTPTPSHHAARERWPARSTTPELGLEDAWQQAHTLEITYENSGHGSIPRHDEARYHPPSGCVIFRRDTTLTTLYDVTPSGVTNEYGRAARLSVIDQYGRPESHPDYQPAAEDHL